MPQTFLNPNNINGIYTSSSFGTQCCPAGSPYLPGYSSSAIPNLNQSGLIADNQSNVTAGASGDTNAVNGTNLVTTIVRNHASTNEVGASYASWVSLSQPTERDDAEKFQWGTPRIPTSSSEQTDKKKNAAILGGLNQTGGTVQVFSGQSERLSLNIAQNNLTLTSSTGDGSGIDLSSVTLAGIAEGVYSYLAYDQNLATTTDTDGVTYMPLVPLKEPGPPRTFNVVYNITGGVGGSPITPDLLNRISKQPPIRVHGMPRKTPHSDPLLVSKGIQQTLIETATAEHTHWFPIRGRVLNSYKTQNDATEIVHPDRRVISSFASRAPFTFNLNIARASRTSSFNF